MKEKKYYIAESLYLKTIKRVNYIDLKIPTVLDYLNNKQYYRKLVLNYINHSLQFNTKIIQILNKSIFYIYLKYLILNF